MFQEGQMDFELQRGVYLVINLSLPATKHIGFWLHFYDYRQLWRIAKDKIFVIIQRWIAIDLIY